MPAPRLRDVQTVHSADATKVWFVWENEGQPRVVYCDTVMYLQTRVLCMRWPPP